MASKLVSAATSDKLAETDWSKNIEICELVARDHRQAKDIVKAIKKRLGSKNQNTQLFAVLLLEMLMNNIGEPVHKQVIDIGALPILVKIVMKTSDLPVRERIFLLLDAAQTSLGGASGRFPQYYNAYYELVCAGVQFPRRLRDIPKPHSTSNANKNSSPDKESAAPQFERHLPRKQEKKVSELSSVLQKAGASLEVLRDVLNTIDSQHPEVAKEEFTLDLVEQCSFAKQRVMQLAVTSLDEVIITRAVELNEQLEIVIRRHDALLDRRPLFMSNQIDHGQEEEEAEQLFRRIRKGKACMLPEDEEEHHVNALLGLMGHPIPDHMLQRPLIRENMEPQREHIAPKQENIQPLNMVLKHEPNLGKAAVAIPPPPAKHVEREKFFQDNKSANGSPALNGLMRNLSLQSRNASSSHSGSTDFSD